MLAVAAGGWAARLRAKGVRTPYTRKIFHFLIFTGAGAVHLLWGFPGTLGYGGVVALVVVVAVLRGSKSGLYEALARPTDAPHRTLFIIVPLVSTAGGGLTANFLFGGYAYIGYLVCGWGDAVGEPVGTRWGRHRYQVPSLSGVPAQRSLEGSGAVLLMGAIAAAAGLLAGGASPADALLVGAAACAAGAAVEAFSNHGLDNLTTQLAAAGVTYALLM